MANSKKIFYTSILSVLVFAFWLTPSFASTENYWRCEVAEYASDFYTQCYYGVDVETSAISASPALNPNIYYWFRDGVYFDGYTTGGSYMGQFGEGTADSCETSPSGSFRYSLSTNSSTDDEFLSGILDCATLEWTVDTGMNSYFFDGVVSSATTTESTSSTIPYLEDISNNIENTSIFIGYLVAFLFGVAGFTIGYKVS